MKLAATCLQLDIGNSGAKWRLLRGADIVARGKYLPGDEASTGKLLDCAPQLDQIWLASVARPEVEAALVELLAGRWDVLPWFARTQARTGELRNSYAEPARMGVDRWLAMVAARARSTDRVCVVDAGSALTIDMVAASGQHEGGYIIPGAALMERALLLDTDRVRFAEEAGYELDPGTSTAQAVRHGIALAQAGALALALEQAVLDQAVLDQIGPEAPRLLFCGGGGAHLMQLLNRGGEYVPDLIFEGLEVMAGIAP